MLGFESTTSEQKVKTGLISINFGGAGIYYPPSPLKSQKRNINDKPVRRNKSGRSREELYKTIKKDLKDIPDDRVRSIIEDIDRENFLPKQLTAGNGVIPNQIHLRELRAILKNASVYLKFLNEKDESGLTVAQRIEKLFSFQIPYYIGPVSEKSENSRGNGWVVRKESGPVMPWNFEEKIDIEKTSHRFIERLVKTCTYMSGEKVLPKASLIYEKFCVLNEINNIRIDGERISADLKQDIFEEIFSTGKKVSRSKIENYLINRGGLKSKEELTGIDSQINNALLSYGKMRDVLGDGIKTDKGKAIAEDIIYLSTIYGDAKSMLKKSLKEKYSGYLSESQIKIIIGFRFKDWGTLSREFLELKALDSQTGEEISLINALWEYNYNMMELIHSNQFDFNQKIEEKKTKLTKLLSEFSVEDLQEYYFSAPVKRMIWQTIGIIKELEQILGKAPKRIFVEMTRTDEEKGDKGRKDSRGKALMLLYKEIKDQSRDWKAEIEKAEQDRSLRSKKLYLYYCQMGRCMYTGEQIDFQSLLYDNNQYDIDHIYPRHFVKDDNLSNNLVLVKKSSNAYKSDKYPLPEMKPEVYELWKALHANKLMNDEKYRRLTGKQQFTEEQKADFIARQLVETGQGTKGVADLLKQLLPETTIVYSKGRNVSDFRRDYNMLKSRTVNDFHHAKDAYLNIVVGNVYYVKFTQNPLNYMHKLEKEHKSFNYHLGKMFNYDVVRDNEIAWIAESKNNGPGTIQLVKKIMDKNTPMITRMNFESHGQFSNINASAARITQPDTYIPIKSSDSKMLSVSKYGGYTTVKSAYFFLVEHEKKNKKIKTLESIPVFLSKACFNDDSFLLKYCEDILGLQKPRICLKKIKMKSLFKIDGFFYYFHGWHDSQRLSLFNAVSLCLDSNWGNYIHAIDKYVEAGIISKDLNITSNIELYNILKDKHVHGIFSKRQQSIGIKLENVENVFENKTLEEQCKLLHDLIRFTLVDFDGANLKELVQH